MRQGGNIRWGSISCPTWATPLRVGYLFDASLQALWGFPSPHFTEEEPEVQKM